MARLGGAVLTWPLAAHGQQPAAAPRIGYVFSFVASEGHGLWEACRQGLRGHGYVEDKNIVLEPRWAAGRHERLPELVAELVRLRASVIVAAATPASRAAKAATSTIPIVFVAVADPTRIGLVESFSRPGGNVTGISLLTPELSGKRLQMLLEIAKTVAHVGVLTNPSNLSHSVFLEETMTAARSMRVRVSALHARDPREIEQAFEQATAQNIQALIVFDDPVIWSYRKLVTAMAVKARLPVMYGYSEFVADGGLISYGPYRPDLYRRTADYVDKILRGAKPADLPVERPTKFELFVNLNNAKALGLLVPTSILLSADKIIE